MKVGDLVKFKQPDFHEHYGVGIMVDGGGTWYGMQKRHWVVFNNERVMVRLDELEVINESR